ncbi:MAG: type II secretion system F family protein [Acidimicrobiia bacterium]
MSGSPLVLVAAGAASLAAALVVHALFPPARSLSSRINPYLSPSRSVSRRPSAAGPLAAVFGPMIRSVAESVGRLLERSGEHVTILELRQAGWYRDVSEEETVPAFRLAQLRSIAIGVVLALLVGQVLGLATVQWVVLVVLGLVVGATRQRSALNSAVAYRRDRMRIEIYTINQLLAMRVRAGGGVVHAVQEVVRRGDGEVVAELADALRLHRSGWRAGDAFRRIAELTPEPFCGRTYRLLATAEERGADLAPALLDLAEDVRETRRESIRRSATKRRAAMLVPIIAILAPVLILFVAAPLPYLITGWR